MSKVIEGRLFIRRLQRLVVRCTALDLVLEDGSVFKAILKSKDRNYVQDFIKEIRTHLPLARIITQHGFGKEYIVYCDFQKFYVSEKNLSRAERLEMLENRESITGKGYRKW